MFEQINVKTLFIELTDKCNLNCTHCFNRPYAINNTMSLENFNVILEKASDNYIKKDDYQQKVILTGGEIFMHPRIKDIIEVCKNHTEKQFVLTTNGLLLTDELIQLIEESPNLTIQISVDGVSKEVYEKQRGKNTFDKFMRGFNLIKNSRIKLKTTRTCITLLNYLEVEKICEFAVQNNFIPSFIFLLELGNGKINQEHLSLSVAQKVVSMNRIYKFNKEKNQKIRLPEITTSCTFAEEMEIEGLFIKPNGDIAPCQMFYDDVVGNIINESIDQILCYERFEKYYRMAKERKNALSSSHKCRDCLVYNRCGMGCMGMANSNGNILSYDGQCDIRVKAFFGHINDLI
jgi:molybdenum cofactor biosynthesis protein A